MKFVNVVVSRFFAEQDLEYIAPASEDKSMCDAFVDEFNDFPCEMFTC